MLGAEPRHHCRVTHSDGTFGPAVPCGTRSPGLAVPLSFLQTAGLLPCPPLGASTRLVGGNAHTSGQGGQGRLPGGGGPGCKQLWAIKSIVTLRLRAGPCRAIEDPGSDLPTGLRARRGGRGLGGSGCQSQMHWRRRRFCPAEWEEGNGSYSNPQVRT